MMTELLIKEAVSVIMGELVSMSIYYDVIIEVMFSGRESVKDDQQ